MKPIYLGKIEAVVVEGKRTKPWYHRTDPKTQRELGMVLNTNPQVFRKMMQQARTREEQQFLFNAAVQYGNMEYCKGISMIIGGAVGVIAAAELAMIAPVIGSYVGTAAPQLAARTMIMARNVKYVTNLRYLMARDAFCRGTTAVVTEVTQGTSFLVKNYVLTKSTSMSTMLLKGSVSYSSQVVGNVMTDMAYNNKHLGEAVADNWDNVDQTSLAMDMITSPTAGIFGEAILGAKRGDSIDAIVGKASISTMAGKIKLPNIVSKKSIFSVSMRCSDAITKNNNPAKFWNRTSNLFDVLYPSAKFSSDFMGGVAIQSSEQFLNNVIEIQDENN